MLSSTSFSGDLNSLLSEDSDPFKYGLSKDSFNAIFSFSFCESESLDYGVDYESLSDEEGV